MTRAQQQKYDAACSAARLWASHAPIDELRQGNADRLARSYGITPADANSIIVKAYKARRA